MAKKDCGCKWNLTWDWSQKPKTNRRRRPMRKTRRTKRTKKTRGGGYSAANYGSFVWGTNQTNDPSQGNVIKAENNPVTIKGGEGLPTQGLSQTQGLTQIQASNPMEMYKEMTKLQIPSVVESNTYKGGRKQKSKRKYT